MQTQSQTQTTDDVKTNGAPAAAQAVEGTAAPAPVAARPRPLAARKIAELIERAVARSGISCAVQLASGDYLRFGTGEPQFTIRFHSDKPLLGSMSEYALGTAYINGEFDIEGDMWAVQEVRSLLEPRGNARIALSFLWELFAMPATWVNKRAVDQHYTRGDDFYLSYLDERYHFYSHCLFKSDDETLEEAAENKHQTMWRTLRLEPGQKLLDIGGGWGTVHAFCGPRGVAVTSLTLAEDSEKYIRALDERLGLDKCSVQLQDFLTYEPPQQFDAIVIYGVIEHIPNYRRFAERVWECLKPGGRIYIDASASIEKYQRSDFISAYIWSGAHSFLCLQDITQELLFHGLDIIETVNETHDYSLTMRHWAQNLEAKKDFIVSKWGERTYRLWRIYLWTGSYGFHVDSIQAYHIVAEKRADRGPRPGLRKRVGQFLRSFK
ncbi:MAG: class I SAM-dependent methyltransferase [Candidatus Eremiobacteraeota bacterium]|nr:class I SAM-dependent methyltransferase [Candidatus Eremiobacteraeota bacterium]